MDSWDDVLTYRHVTSWEQAIAYQGTGLASFIALSERLTEFRRQSQIPDDFDELGVEDDRDDESNIIQTVWWARRGSYRYVPSDWEHDCSDVVV